MLTRDAWRVVMEVGNYVDQLFAEQRLHQHPAVQRIARARYKVQIVLELARDVLLFRFGKALQQQQYFFLIFHRH